MTWGEPSSHAVRQAVLSAASGFGVRADVGGNRLISRVRDAQRHRFAGVSDRRIRIAIAMLMHDRSLVKTLRTFRAPHRASGFCHAWYIRAVTERELERCRQRAVINCSLPQRRASK